MKILLVEDDARLSARLKDDLSRRGYAVDVADNGIDAEHLGTEWEYDAVVLDLGLPLRSGLDTLRHWRAQHNPVPVLILTARDAWHEKVDGFQAGADDYLGKPFHTEELVARLQALIRRSHAQPGGAVSVAGLTLDEARQSVLVDARPIALSGVEFRLLRYFMLHPGQILSKTRLSEHLYDNDSERDSNVIEVHVNRLRNKLGPDYITTRRGQGYVFGGAA
ncbi:response regulator transcription factor [Duganella sp. FT3S]|uniref:Response regulator transcription factor n=1 Tax=Rugamonas fusca TaxID=2758568 RepID=A0A7W2EKF0_9BURK|nr:response regulator transcription factor [Rugamonas fusca]MBA5607526.1 response regulator transcription factor [Rugamonas fusca]